MTLYFAGSAPITARMVPHAQGISPADDGDKQKSTILPTENQDWGFWGTMREHAAPAWRIAFTAIHNATSTDPASVRAFLDSRCGRHFADGVNSQMHYGASFADAIAKTTAEWMGWRITQRTSRETGIPAGLPYLTGSVINEGIAAEAQN
jgi:hypothetical protein